MILNRLLQIRDANFSYCKFSVLNDKLVKDRDSITLFSVRLRHYSFMFGATSRLYLILVTFSFHCSKDDINVMSFSLIRSRCRLILFTLNLSLNTVNFFLLYFLYLPSISSFPFFFLDRFVSFQIPRDRNTERKRFSRYDPL